MAQHDHDPSTDIDDHSADEAFPLDPKPTDLTAVGPLQPMARPTKPQTAAVLRAVAALLIMIVVIAVLAVLRSQLMASEAGNAPASPSLESSRRAGVQSAAKPAAQPIAATAVATMAVQMAPVQAVAVTDVPPALPDPNFVAKTAPDAPLDQPNPLFAPTYQPNDGLPVYICGADAFASYLPLLQIQVMGADIANGFHLGIVPYSLNDKGYGVSQELADTNIRSGQWDCELNTLDSVARTSYGVITAIVDESAGGDGMWARRVNSVYDLKGKRIAYVRDTSAEFFARYALLIAQLDPNNDVTLLPFDTMEEAIDVFNSGGADAVSGWEPNLSEAAKGGGSKLVMTDQLRVIVDAMVTSRKSIETRPDVVQAFHNAWFAAIKVQTDYFDIGAAQIAGWGNNDWSGISKENASADLSDQLASIAQATLADNLAVVNNNSAIISHMSTARRVWSVAGVTLPNDQVDALIEPRFITQAALQPKLQTDKAPINDTFSLGAETKNANGNATSGSETLAVLPCRKFTFLPDSTALTDESRKVLELCVLPALQQRAGVQLRIRGSAAWPGPAGTFAEADILGIAQARAQAIADYLVSQKIDTRRIMVEAVLPPAEHRETQDVTIQAADRFVEMSLVASQ